MDLSLVENYMPTSPSEASIRNAYTRLQTWFKDTDPDLDTRPGSVFGDNYLLPAARLIAAREEGLDLLTDDMNLQNVANGYINNCEFVEMFLSNFGVTDGTPIQSSGIARFVFSVGTGVTLGDHLQFGNNDSVYQIRKFGASDIRVLPVGSSRITNNDYVLTQSSPTRYYVDIPLESYDSIEIEDGDVFEVTESVTGLSSVTALGDFFTSSATASLSDLARKTRKTFHASSMGTKSGISNVILREFPDLVSVSPVIQGQSLMTRSYANQFGVSTPCCDVFVKSPFYGSTYKQVVRLEVDSGCFWGPVEFSATPLHVKSVTLATTVGELDYQVWERSKDEVQFPQLSCAFSNKADRWIRVDNPNGDIPYRTDADNRAYQYFEVTYLGEPLSPLVERWLTLPENSPLGVSINVRACYPLVLESMTFNYRRDRGTNMDYTSVKSEIVNYLSSLSWPDNYTDAALADILFNNGVRQLNHIDCVGELKVSAATHYIDDEDATTLSEFEAARTEIPSFALSSGDSFLLEYLDDSAPESNLFYAAGPENVGFTLETSQIILKEER